MALNQDAQEWAALRSYRDQTEFDLRRLFAEGAFATAFVPVLTEYKTKRDFSELKDFVDHLAIVVTVTLLVLRQGQSGILLLCLRELTGRGCRQAAAGRSKVTIK